MLMKCAVISAGLALLGPAPAAGFSMSSSSIATLMAAFSRRSMVLLPCVDRPASRRSLQMADKPASDASGPGQREISSRVDKFGTREYWDEMYRGEGSLPAEEYSWYCDWKDLAPFWGEIVPDRSAQVLVPGCGNDMTIAEMYDAGWRQVTAFDFSADAVVRARKLYGERKVALLCADAQDLPLDDNTFDAVLDKGALDAMGIAGEAVLSKAAQELARVVKGGGLVVAVSGAIAPSKLAGAFRDSEWAMLRGSTLWRAGLRNDGERETPRDNLDAFLFVWRRK